MSIHVCNHILLYTYHALMITLYSNLGAETQCFSFTVPSFAKLLYAHVPGSKRDPGLEIRDLDGSWILTWHFVEGFNGSWILSTHFCEILWILDLVYKDCCWILWIPDLAAKKIIGSSGFSAIKETFFSGRCGFLELPVTLLF